MRRQGLFRRFSNSLFLGFFGNFRVIFDWEV